MTPIWGDMQMARVLNPSHAGKKPLARLPVATRGRLPDHGGGQVSATIRVALPPDLAASSRSSSCGLAPNLSLRIV
jgi:hypothetical protein